jgi:hypothetical protein
VLAQARDLLAANESREGDEYRPHVAVGTLGIDALGRGDSSHELIGIERLGARPAIGQPFAQRGGANSAASSRAWARERRSASVCSVARAACSASVQDRLAFCSIVVTKRS